MSGAAAFGSTPSLFGDLDPLDSASVGIAPARTSLAAASAAAALRTGSIPSGAALGAGASGGAVVEQLAKQLDDERNLNRKRAQEYQESQQRQAQLVQKLQTKVRAPALDTSRSTFLAFHRNHDTVEQLSCRF